MLRRDSPECHRSLQFRLCCTEVNWQLGICRQQLSIFVQRSSNNHWDRLCLFLNLVIEEQINPKYSEISCWERLEWGTEKQHGLA
jgi:hypothetical protein